MANLHGEPNFRIGWLYCLVLGLAINAFQDSESRILNVAAEKIALYSYGMYLLHVPVLYLVFVVLGIRSPVVGPLLFVLLTVSGSVITYHLIEAPLIAFGRLLSSRPSRLVPRQEEVV
jgi:peptidoglycan/LPS O-acetylase OafA/YrhL